MVVDGNTLPGSNISVLVNTKSTKLENKSLVEQLSKTELPRGLVGNAEISRELSQRKRKSNTPSNLPSKVLWTYLQKWLIDIITLANRVVSAAHPPPKDIWKET